MQINVIGEKNLIGNFHLLQKILWVEFSAFC